MEEKLSTEDSPPPIAGEGGAVSDFKRLRIMLRPEKADIVAVFIFAVAIGLLQLATPIAVQSIVNAVAFGGLIQPLIVISLLLLLALGLASAFYCIQTWAVELLQQRLFVRLVADLAARLPRVKFEEYHSGHGPEFVNRFFDVLTIQKAAPKLLIDALGMILAVAVGLSVLAVYHPLLLVFDVFLLAVIVVILFLPLRRGERSAVTESTAKFEVAAWLEEIAKNPHTFRNGGAQQWIFDKTDELTQSWVKARKSHFNVIFSQTISVQMLYVISSVILLGLGGWLVINESLSIGQLVAAELIVSGIVASVAKSGKHLETWYDLMAAVSKVGQLLDVNVEHTGGEVPPASPDKMAALEFVDLAWINTRNQRLCPSIDLKIKPSEKIAITGSDGAGKMALIDLLWRMQDPISGNIRLDGRDIRDLAVDVLRSEIAVVSVVEIVKGTVSENISLNRASVTRDDVRRAIADVGLEEVVSRLPERLDTELYALGNVLTESELQRLMLARAMAGAPSVLVVDARFDSNLPHTRKVIFDSLFAADRPWTLIVISELPEVIERCDRVLHLKMEEDTQEDAQPNPVVKKKGKD